MTYLEMAAFLATKTTAEIAALMPQVVAKGGMWFTTSRGISTFLFSGRAASSDHSPAEAAKLWGEGILNRGPIEDGHSGSAGLAGVDSEIIDPFLVNRGALWR